MKIDLFLEKRFYDRMYLVGDGISRPWSVSRNTHSRGSRIIETSPAELKE